MTDSDAAKLIEEVFKSHWPNWRFEGEETKVWTGILRKYDYVSAKTAINNFYILQTKQGKPAPALIVEVLRQNAYSRETRPNEPILLYTIIKESSYLAGRSSGIYGKRFYISGKKQKPASEEIERMAERDRRLANQIYGENHIIIRSWEHEKEIANYPQTRKESLEAKEHAFADILSGKHDVNNGKTKRWLQRYLNKNSKPKKEQESPVLIGEAFEDKVPF